MKLSVEFIYCHCKCGKTKPRFDKRGREFRFIKWHQPRGKNSKWWKGGEYINKRGYAMLYRPDHPKALSNGTVLKHRVVYEEYYKCCILPWVDVHHINGDKLDNRIENLKAILHKEHSRMSATKDMSGRVCIECGSRETKVIGYPRWIKHPITKSGWVCYWCYFKIRYRVSH